jgi:hypothetical protein
MVVSISEDNILRVLSIGEDGCEIRESFRDAAEALEIFHRITLRLSSRLMSAHST